MINSLHEHVNRVKEQEAEAIRKQKEDDEEERRIREEQQAKQNLCKQLEAQLNLLNEQVAQIQDKRIHTLSRMQEAGIDVSEFAESDKEKEMAAAVSLQAKLKEIEKELQYTTEKLDKSNQQLKYMNVERENLKGKLAKKEEELQQIKNKPRRSKWWLWVILIIISYFLGLES